MSNWPHSPTNAAAIIADMKAMAEQVEAQAGRPRATCQPFHPVVRHFQGRLVCLVCEAIYKPTPDQACACLRDLSLVFERDGVYHAKPGRCADQALSEDP